MPENRPEDTAIEEFDPLEAFGDWLAAQEAAGRVLPDGDSLALVLEWQEEMDRS